jgi:hypothetical protein
VGVAEHSERSEPDAADQFDDDGQQKCNSFRAGDGE